MRRCWSRKRSPLERATPGTCRGAPATRRGAPAERAPSPAAPAACTSARRARARAPASGPPRAARAGGGSSRPREARAWPTQGTKRRPRQIRRVAAGEPAQRRSRRRRRAGRRGGGRRGPRTTASSGACSRVWSVPGVVGSQPWSAVSTSRSPGRRSSSQPATAASISRSARVEALDVLAVPVDLVGLDEVGEHEARRRARAAARSSPRSPRAFVGPGCECVDADAGEQLAAPCPPRGPATPASRSSSGGSATAGGSAKSRRPSVRTNAPGAPSNGPRDHAADGVLAGHQLARRGARGVQLRRGATTSTCAAICITESCDV